MDYDEVQDPKVPSQKIKYELEIYFSYFFPTFLSFVYSLFFQKI